MIPRTRIFFAFCFALCAKCSKSDEAVCDEALSAYFESIFDLSRAERRLTVLSARIPDHYSAQQSVGNNLESNSTVNYTEAQGAINNLCGQFNLLALAAENITIQCSDTCKQYGRLFSMPFAADVLNAFTKVCKDIQTEKSTEAIMQDVRTVGMCWVSLTDRWSDRNYWSVRMGIDMARLSTLVNKEYNVSDNNSTLSCQLVCARKCACRWAQIEVPMHTDRPNATVLQVCGKEGHNLALELQERVLNALHCADFGDYVRNWGWLQVNYRANKTTPALHQ